MNSFGVRSLSLLKQDKANNTSLLERGVSKGLEYVSSKQAKAIVLMLGLQFLASGSKLQKAFMIPLLFSRS